MKNSSLSSLFLPIFAALAIYFPLTSALPVPEKPPAPALTQPLSPPSPTPSPATGAGTEDGARLSGEASRLLCDFFGDYFRKDTKDQPTGFPSQMDSAHVKGDYCKLSAVKTNFELEFLVATMPDPKDSRLDYLFDRHLDAIQRAIETAGYVLDRHWLPWERAKTASGSAGAGTNSPPSTQTAQRQITDPGVLIFRRSDNGGLLALFLIGETPTYGIHKLGFQSALSQIEQLSKIFKTKPIKGDFCQLQGQSVLRILGPTFTGSATSLALSLKSWLDQPGTKTLSKACVITGSAMAIKKDKFTELVGHKGEVQLFATVIPEQASRTAFFNHLVNETKPFRWWMKSWLLPTDEKSDPGRTHIAMLSEATTSYGLETRAGQSKPASKSNPSPAPTPCPEVSAAASFPPVPSPTPLALQLTFPLHISQLRIEAAKANNGNSHGASSPLPLKESNLSLPLGEAGARDIVQPFSTMEAVTTELVLSEILSSIDRERIRYVGVSSTDVLDRIFLIRKLRQECPNTVIFTFSSDMLYLHSEASLDAQGVLVISPYPLFDQNQRWTYPFTGQEKRFQFTTQTAQGVFNAALALLRKPDALLEYGDPFQNYNKDRARRPALWLAIVGRNKLWPVTTLKYDDPDKYVWEARVEENIAAPSRALPDHPVSLVRSYFSPLGLGFLLLVGVVCLIPSLILVLQLLLFSLQQEDKSSAPPAPFWAMPVKWFLRMIRRLNIRLGIGPLALRRIKQWRVGQIFGDEEETIYRYRYVRRVYLMACCTGLLTVTLFTSGISLMLELCGIEIAISEADRWQYQVIHFFSYFNLIGVSLAFVLLFFSVARWTVGGWRHLRGSQLAAISLLVGLMMMALTIAGLYEMTRRGQIHEKVLFFLRATDITNGVSLLFPVTLLGLALFLTYFSAVRRLNLSERMACLPSPKQNMTGTACAFLRLDHDDAQSFQGVAKIEGKIREFIVGRGISGGTVFFLSLLILVIYSVLFLAPYTPTVDGRFFDLFFKWMFYLVPMSLILAFMWFIATWAAVRGLLRRLSWHPLFARFAAAHQEEKRFTSLPQIDLLSPPPTYTALSLSVRQARHFMRELEVTVEKWGQLTHVQRLVMEAESELSQAMESEAKCAWQEALTHRRDSEERMCELSETVSALLEPTWKTAAGKDADEAKSWHDEGKFFLLAHVAAFLQHIFAHLQNLVALVTGGLLLVLLASNSYPFQPRQPLLLFSWVTILTVVAVTLFVFVQMSRDKVLSILSGTTPGKLTVTRDLVVRVLIHGVLPIVALLGVQFPEALRQIFSWLNLLQGGGR